VSSGGEATCTLCTSGKGCRDTCIMVVNDSILIPSPSHSLSLSLSHPPIHTPCTCIPS
jgi:hypothetical protein